MHISRADIDRATDEARDPWAVSDGVLYSLCKKHQDHQDTRASTAKMLLIGRTYAASAERGRSAGNSASLSGDAFYTKALPRALKRSRLDALMDLVRSERYATEENVVASLAVHSELMKVLRELTGVEKRSLASKYLHFHVPQLFFLFDSRADATLSRISPIRKRSSSLRALGGDLAYTRFVSCALALRGQLEARFGVRLSPRYLDRILLTLEAARGEA